MDSPLLRTLMGILFTIVGMTVTFILVGILVGQWIGPLGMMITVLVSGVAWWVAAQHLFRITNRP